LTQFIAPYPDAQIISCFTKNGQESWMFTTKDDPEKVHAFYSDLASRQKISFQDINDMEFVIGVGGQAVSVGVAEDGSDSTILYTYPVR
jgi:hypothetical protein